jgi:hypothetical protein
MSWWGWLLVCLGCASFGAIVGFFAAALMVAPRWPG